MQRLPRITRDLCYLARRPVKQWTALPRASNRKVQLSGHLQPLTRQFSSFHSCNGEASVAPDEKLYLTDSVRRLAEAGTLSDYLLTETMKRVPDESLSMEEVKELKSVFSSNQSYKSSRRWFPLLVRLANNNNKRQVGASLVDAIHKDESLMTLGNFLAAVRFYACDSDTTAPLKAVIDLMKKKLDADDWTLIERELKNIMSVKHWDVAVELFDSEKYKNEKTESVTTSECEKMLSSDASQESIFSSVKCRTLLRELFNSQPNTDEEVEEAKKKLTHLLHSLNIHNYCLTEPTVKLMLKWFSSLPGEKWMGVLNSSVHAGVCTNCQARLKPHSLSDLEISTLRENMRYEMKNNPLKMYTYEKEYDSFVTFLQNSEKKYGGRFHCIIDLLNLILSSRGMQATDALEKTVSFFANEYNCRRFLLIGKGPKRNRLIARVLERLQNTDIKISIFTTGKRSKDDYFLFEAALWSGPDCYFVSNDLFRQHSALLSPDNRKVFHRWQENRQFTQKFVEFLRPADCEQVIQGDVDSSWHIPYQLYREAIYKDLNQPTYWLCLRKQR